MQFTFENKENIKKTIKPAILDAKLSGFANIVALIILSFFNNLRSFKNATLRNN